MNVSIKILRKDKIIFTTFCITVSFLVITLAYILLMLSQLPPFIPLFNQMLWGEERLGGKVYIFIPLVITFVIMITNSILSSVTYSTNPLIARVLSITSFIISFLVTLFIVRTIGLVI